MVLTVADAKKLTVPRLKEELVKRGIDSAGNKPELLARLTESIEQAAEDLILNGDAHHLLSDDILNEDILDAPSIDGEEDAEKLLGESTTISVDEDETKDDDVTTEEEKKEVVLADKPLNDDVVEQDKRARAIRFGLPVTAELLASDSAKSARAKRFGLPEDANRLASDDAKAKRAERFGIPKPSATADKGADSDAKAARAARFGLPVGGGASGEEKGTGKAAKLAARAKRFGGTVEDEEMEAKKKARLERFGPGSK